MKPLSQFPLDLGYAADHFEDRVSDAVKHTMATAERLAIMNVSGRVLKRRSGNLARSIQTQIKRSRGTVTATLSAGNRNVRYARIHEVGGIIQGRPWLVFQLADGGWRKVERVRIPARPYLGPAMDEALEGLEDDLRDELAPLLSLNHRGVS
jgi:phage gpG-like protein